MKYKLLSHSFTLLTALAALMCAVAPAQAADNKPNIVVIMGDDVGWFNVGAYHQGIMSGKTPNIDRIAREGMRFTDYYAEASCTAGRANFITGELPIRTGLTTVGQAGADVGIPMQACTLATALKAQGYATGQFGKNHLGDLNKYLPTLHGFDEFFGYLYHLDAMSDPYWYSFPVDEAYYNKYGPRSLVHCWATDTDDATVEPRWGKVGKQKVVNEGPLPPFPDMSNVPNMHDLPFLKAKYNMTTFDPVLAKASCDFMDKAKKDGKPFFVWHNTTRMHVWTFLSKKYSSMQNSQTNYGLEEAGMADMDDNIGTLLQHLDDIGEADNTIVVFSTDNGAEVFTWPDGGMTPFKGTKGTVMEGGFRAPCIARWPGKIKPGTVQNGIFSALDWFPTLVAAAGNPNITDQLLKGVKLGDRTYKNHLDGYDQTAAITGKGPSARHEIFYLGESTIGAVRIDDYKYRFIDQPQGWLGEKTHPDVPYLINLRLDPFERQGWPGNGTKDGAQQYFDWFKFQFWRFVFVQQVMGKELQTFLDYPPMQRGASFNLDAVKAEMAKKMQQAEAASKGTGQ